jgi:hypothetical protein
VVLSARGGSPVDDLAVFACTEGFGTYMEAISAREVMTIPNPRKVQT